MSATVLIYSLETKSAFSECYSRIFYRNIYLLSLVGDLTMTWGILSLKYKFKI
jgi:hypothetical protein